MAANTEWLPGATRPGLAPHASPAAGAITVYRLGGRGWLVAAAVAALLAFAFLKPLSSLWAFWTIRAEYSHGPLLPLIAAFLVWQQKDLLERQPFVGSWGGAILVLGAAFAAAVGALGAVEQLQQYAFVAMLAGLALAWTGGAAFRRMLVPVIVLLLMIPLPMFVLNNLSAELQLLSSSLGVALIRAVGISVYLEGNVIDLGGYRLQVVEACDGLRYLFPLMVVGFLVAYFYKGATWKRVLVFGASVPITVLMNSARVGTIGVMVEHWGSAMAEGFLHEFQGWMVFMVSAALLLLLTAALNRVGREAGTWRQLFGLEFPAPTPSGARLVPRPLPAPFLASALVVALCAAGALALPTRTELVPERAMLSGFPLQFDGWTGRPQALDGEVLNVLQHDDYLLADYARGDGSVVNFYVSYYLTQRDRSVVHSPRACIPGGGWRIESMTRVPAGTRGRTVNRMVIANGGARQIVYYWFEQRGRTVTSELLVKWYLFVDALGRSRSDGALVRLITPLAPGEAPAAADARLQRFLAAAEPRLPAYLPP